MNLIKYTKFPKNQYFQEVISKKIAVLHHTASGTGETGDIQWWEQTPDRVGASYIIGRDGKVTEVFDPKYWIHHLGVTAATLKKYSSSVSNERLNQLSVGIEIDSWGQLTTKDGKYYNYLNREVNVPVQTYHQPYRRYSFYEKYTDAQIQALKELLLNLNKELGIPLNYFDEMFTTNQKALKGYHGIWTHSSFREDKNDCHPQPELIAMLKSIKSN